MGWLARLPGALRQGMRRNESADRLSEHPVRQRLASQAHQVREEAVAAVRKEQERSAMPQELPERRALPEESGHALRESTAARADAACAQSEDEWLRLRWPMAAAAGTRATVLAAYPASERQSWLRRRHRRQVRLREESRVQRLKRPVRGLAFPQ